MHVRCDLYLRSLHEILRLIFNIHVCAILQGRLIVSVGSLHVRSLAVRFEPVRETIIYLYTATVIKEINSCVV